MTIDPRLAARRAAVAEGRAKSDLRRLLWLALAAGSVGGVIWLVTSPLMSVQTISSYGVERSQVDSVLAAEGVVRGRPLIVIRSNRVADRIEEDPWVVEASVELIFPDRVEVTVLERTGAAWVNVGDRWAHVADDGVVVEYAPAPPTGTPVVVLDATDPGLGQPIGDARVAGAVEFMAGLEDGLRSEAVLRDVGGELWAEVAGRRIRIGTATDMAAKAAAAAAVIEYAGAEGGGVIDVIAPSRPAIWGESDPDPPPDSEAAAAVEQP